MTDAEKVAAALHIAICYCGVDGEHHKSWVIDQMIRVLTGGDYDRIIAEYCDGEDGPNTFEHDVGIAP
jgi:hypothetical protein